MITIQRPETQHTGALIRFIEEHRLVSAAPVNPEASMILIEDGTVLGYASYSSYEDEASVTLLFIDPVMRGKGFGDGLLRALLNLMERNGILRFYIPADEAAQGFLLAEGLCRSESVPAWATAPMNGPFWFEGALPEFFQKPCKGGRLKP